MHLVIDILLDLGFFFLGVQNVRIEPKPNDGCINGGQSRCSLVIENLFLRFVGFHIQIGYFSIRQGEVDFLAVSIGFHHFQVPLHNLELIADNVPIGKLTAADNTISNAGPQGRQMLIIGRVEFLAAERLIVVSGILVVNGNRIIQPQNEGGLLFPIYRNNPGNRHLGKGIAGVINLFPGGIVFCILVIPSRFGLGIRFAVKCHLISIQISQLYTVAILILVVILQGDSFLGNPFVPALGQADFCHGNIDIGIGTKYDRSIGCDTAAVGSHVAADVHTFTAIAALAIVSILNRQLARIMGAFFQRIACRFIYEAVISKTNNIHAVGGTALGNMNLDIFTSACHRMVAVNNHIECLVYVESRIAAKGTEPDTAAVAIVPAVVASVVDIGACPGNTQYVFKIAVRRHIPFENTGKIRRSCYVIHRRII